MDTAKNNEQMFYMTKYEFEQLSLSWDDKIWLVDEQGNGNWGHFKGQYNPTDQTFKFKNHANGHEEMISIMKLQRLEKKN